MSPYICCNFVVASCIMIVITITERNGLNGQPCEMPWLWKWSLDWCPISRTENLRFTYIFRIISKKILPQYNPLLSIHVLIAFVLKVRPSFLKCWRGIEKKKLIPMRPTMLERESEYLQFYLKKPHQNKATTLIGLSHFWRGMELHCYWLVSTWTRYQESS